MNAMMKQVQQMQSEMMEAQEKLKDEVVEASAGGGMVKVKMSGDLRLLEVTIDPEAIDPEEAELLQDMVLAAVNEAIRSAQELATSKLGGIAGGAAGSADWACQSAPPAALGSRRCTRGRSSDSSPSSPACPGSGSGRRSGSRSTSCAPTTPRPSARRRDPRGQGEGGAVRGLLQPRRGRAMPDLRGREPRPSLICVVEEPSDVIPIERTGEYRGLYHVLGGALSPIDGIDPEDLKIAELVRRVDAGGVEELVLATNPTTTGEATAHHIAELLRDRVTITRLASGLPVGADLEHADEVTLGRALAGRWRSIARPRLGQGLSGSTERAVASGPPALRPWASG